MERFGRGKRLRIRKGAPEPRKIRVAEFSFYVDQLRSEECFCGKKKRYGYTFCYRCYMALPEDIRERVTARLPEGLDVAFEEAVKVLDDMGMIEK